MYLKLSDGACEIFKHIHINIHMTGLRYGYITGRIYFTISTTKNTVEIDENQRSRYCRRTVESVKSSRRYIRYIERLLHFIFRNFY